MAQQQPLPEQAGARDGLPRIGFRRLSIAIMLVGAAGFVAALLIYGENLLCLSGSTLVTLGGLALLITARRMGLAPAPARIEPSEEEPLRRGKIPPALRRSGKRASAGSSTAEAPAPAYAPPPPPMPGSDSFPPGSLVERVITVLESQGARVAVEQSMPGRAILRILLSDGQEYAALALEEGLATTADARALLALTARFASGRGFLIAQEGFYSEVYQWAAGRGKIRLVSGDELDELGV